MNFPDITDYKEIAFDTETTGLNPMAGARVFGFSISSGQWDRYWDIRETPQAVHWFNDQMKCYKGTIICHNLSFDYRLSKATGLHFNLENCVDTGLLACLINEHELTYTLDYLAGKYTNSPKLGQELYDELAEIFGGRATKNVQMKNITRAPIAVVSSYAKGDTRATYDLYQWQKKEIEKQGLEKIQAFEQSCTPLIIASEMHGVRVDTPAAEQAVVTLTTEIKAKQKQLDDIAGFRCNFQPSGHIKKLFEPVYKEGRWWANDGTPLEFTEAGAASIGADALRIMSHPAAELILELRSLARTRDTFLVGHILESAQNGRVYPSVNQVRGEENGTKFGRLSYSGPALQQIPDRNKKVAERVKRIFLPDEGHAWVDADKASFEVRIFAHLVGGGRITQAYKDYPETDFHQYVADETGLVRNATYGGQPNAKQLNLSMIFTQGNGATAQKMGMPWEWDSFTARDGKEIIYKKAGPEAQAVIDRYHEKIPGVKELAKKCKETAEQRGYLFTKDGRHLRFPGGYKSYKASGILIQATSADQNKRSWRRIHQALEHTDAKMLLNTHDSYSLSMPIGEEEKIAKKVKEYVEADRGLRVPLILEVNHPGENWWISKSSKRWM